MWYANYPEPDPLKEMGIMTIALAEDKVNWSHIGRTSPAAAKAYTFGIEINKIDGSSEEPMEGVGFMLKKFDAEKNQDVYATFSEIEEEIVMESGPPEDSGNQEDNGDQEDKATGEIEGQANNEDLTDNEGSEGSEDSGDNDPAPGEGEGPVTSASPFMRHIARSAS